MCRAFERHGWMVCYAFMLAFFLVMVPSLAYADTYVATEDSAVRAAMVYLGYDPDEGESTNKLVTAFYDATSGEEYTGWQSFVNGLYQPLTTVNYNEQWWSPADGFMFSSLVDGARSDAAKIYAAWKSTSGGGSGGGGGTSGYYNYLGYVPYTTTGFAFYLGSNWNMVNNSGENTSTTYGLVPNKLLFRLPKESVDSFLSLCGEGYSLGNTCVEIDCISYNGNLAVHIFASTNSLSSYMEVKNRHIGALYYDRYQKISGAADVFKYASFNVPSSDYVVTGGLCSIQTLPLVTQLTTSVPRFFDRSFIGVYSFGSGGVVPDPEPEPEPEPEPPTPPEPPRDPTPPTPDPTQPSQTIDLQGIIDRLDIIIRNQVVLINWLDDAFASVNQNIQWLGELIDESFGWLWEVLGKLQSSIDSGISRITTWLEMIYNKIGGQGGTVSRPNIDTPTPWDDFLSWIEGIIKSLLDKIFGVTPAALQNLLSGLADLTSKFPFSIPWDLAGLITLFVHEPVTPVFDLPLYMPFAGNIVNFHIDLSTWDDVMQIARDGEVILFSAWLIMATPDFYKHLNSVTGSD